MSRITGFLGCGNMGGAILGGLAQSGFISASDMIAFDISKAGQEKARLAGAAVAPTPRELAERSDIVVLAVKPQNMKEALSSMGEAVEGKCLISIAAGLTTWKLRSMTMAKCRILRIMPNAPAMVGAGAFALCSDSDLDEEEKDFAEAMFKSLGEVQWVSEQLMDAVCGLSGSGPAFAAMFIEALADAAVREGLPRDKSYALAAQTVLGTARMVLEKNMHPGVLKDMVASPAGTTIEGCYELEKGGLRACVYEAVHAATKRSRELS